MGEALPSRPFLILHLPTTCISIGEKVGFSIHTGNMRANLQAQRQHLEDAAKL